jgi:multiple sugar transport system substrate-binding protein
MFYLTAVLFLAACQSLVFFPAATPSLEPTKRPVQISTATPDLKATLAAELQIAPSTLVGTEISFWQPLTGKSGAVITQLVNEFNQINPYGIFVTPTNYGSQSELAVAVQTATGNDQELPEVIMASKDQMQLWNDEIEPIVDLDPYIHQPGTGLTEGEISDLFPIFFDQLQPEVARLGIPAYRTGEVLFYNQTWAQELGFPNPPLNVNEFKAQACAAAKENAADKKKSNDGTGGWYIDAAWQSAVSWLNSFGYSQIPSSGDETYTFSSPSAENAFKFIREISDQGCAWSGRQSDPSEYFSTRQALFYSGSMENIESQLKTNARLDSKDDWIPIAYPVEIGLSGVLSDGLDLGIFSGDAKSQMSAWLFIKWMMNSNRHARLAAADTTFPLSYSEVASLSALGEKNPQWQQALGLISQIKSAPRAKDWWIVRQILEDAFWKSLQPNVKPDEIPILLRELDATIYEVLNQ